MNLLLALRRRGRHQCSWAVPAACAAAATSQFFRSKAAAAAAAKASDSPGRRLLREGTGPGIVHGFLEEPDGVCFSCGTVAMQRREATFAVGEPPLTMPVTLAETPSACRAHQTVRQGWAGWGATKQHKALRRRHTFRRLTSAALHTFGKAWHLAERAQYAPVAPGRQWGCLRWPRRWQPAIVGWKRRSLAPSRRGCCQSGRLPCLREAAEAGPRPTGTSPPGNVRRHLRIGIFLRLIYCSANGGMHEWVESVEHSPTATAPSAHCSRHRHPLHSSQVRRLQAAPLHSR